jgi:lipopolysaccharide/colanic/teichoic acid biosynthesis glycosyltransferase
VVRGEMALVGPTPVPQGLVARWKDLVPDAELRFSVRPGVTGLAQLSGDSEEDVAGLVRRAALDLDYVERRSPWLDLGILLRTAGTIIAPRSAAQHDQPRSAAPVRR